MDNPTRRSDPVYDIKLCEKPLSPAPSSPAPAPVEMAQGLAESGSVRAIFASRRDCATQPATSLYGADISGTLDGDETEFVLAVMRLATGAHPFAAIRMLTLAIIELRRGPTEREPKLSTGDALAGDNMARILAHCGTQREFAELIRPDDPRKPWVEPTVTELARHPASATLTIAGIDLPNPAPLAPTIAPTAAEILNATGWLRNRAGLQPVRTAEFESIARIMEGLGAEIVRQAAEIAELRNPIILLKERMQVYPGWSDDFTKAMALIDRQAAELSELQGLLKEAAPAVRFVSELATLTDTEVDFMGVGEIRATARGKIGEPYGFTLPRLYGEADRERAIDVLDDSGVFISLDATAKAVDAVAEALGLQRAC